MKYQITPVAKPRMTQSDRWKTPPRPSVQKYRNFKDLVAINHIKLPIIGSHITFILPMPKSWSIVKKERMNNRYHQQTPDLDNLLKSLGDSIYSQDSIIADIHVTKRWGYEGQIIVEQGR